MLHDLHLPFGPFYGWQTLVTFGGGLLLVVGTAVAIVCAAFYEELAAWLEKWRGQHQPLTNQKQKPAIRASIARLSSPRRYVRVEGLRLLAQFGDPACVLALLRVVDMYADDVPFLIDVVGLLAQLGDDRALPTLRRLSVNRHHALTQAAHQAIDAIEPRSVLLRAGSAPMPAARTLLRPAMPTVCENASDTLLRAGASCGADASIEGAGV